MNEPDAFLARGTRVRTHAQLVSADGLRVAPSHLDARRPDATGTISGPVTAHGGDAYYVLHPEAEVSAAYRVTEFDVLPPNDEAASAARKAA